MDFVPWVLQRERERGRGYILLTRLKNVMTEKKKKKEKEDSLTSLFLDFLGDSVAESYDSNKRWGKEHVQSSYNRSCCQERQTRHQKIRKSEIKEAETAPSL